MSVYVNAREHAAKQVHMAVLKSLLADHPSYLVLQHYSHFEELRGAAGFTTF